MIRVLVTSEIHLGYTSPISKITDADRISILKKTIYNAKEHDLLIIIGNLFHDHKYNDVICNEVISLFKELEESGTKILILPSESEKEDGLLSQNLLKLKNDYLLNAFENNFYPISINDENLIIYPGIIHSSNIFKNIKKTDRKGFHLGIFNVNLSKYSNFQSELIKYIQSPNSISFFALGFEQSIKLYKFQNNIIAAFPGSQEIIDETEFKIKYLLSLTIENGNMTGIKRIPINNRKTIQLDFNYDSYNSFDEIMTEIKPKFSKVFNLKLRLVKNMNFDLKKEHLEELKNNFFKTEIHNITNTDIYTLISENVSDNSLKGEFFQTLENSIRDNPETYNIEFITSLISRFPIKDYENLEEWICSLINA